jgi:multidrug efflux pump subunit AcrA (membrane-fusion protein)
MRTQDENPFYRLGQSMAQQGLDLQAARETIEALQAELAKSQAQVKWHKGCEGHCDEELEQVKAELANTKESAWMANGCLDMVRELLATELDMEHTPPMMYPEAIAAVVGKRTAKLETELQQAREALKHYEKNTCRRKH